MALLFAEGFDAITTTASLNAAGWTNGGTITFQATEGRFGGRCLSSGSSGASLSLPFGAKITGDTALFAFAFRQDTLQTDLQEKFALRRGTATPGTGQTVNTVLRILTSATVCQVVDSVGTVKATFKMSPFAWKHISMKVTALNSGFLWLNIDGVPVVVNVAGDFAGTSATGADWALFWNLPSSNGGGFLDDLVIGDAQGAVPNDLLPDCRVVALMPAGTASNSGWTATGAATVHEALDEKPNDEDTSYVAATVAASAFTVDFENIPLTPSSIVGVSANFRTRKDGVDPATSTVKLVSNSVELSVAGVLATSYAFQEINTGLNPDGNVAWTESSINALQARVEVS